ncbi:CusA/CzcA family heavy metal efflux RND transporter [Alloacidobacterium sp.]|uniref:efflux RND transporter permease subunit n=1 Tax=Alloacidobacterium sp. TaxID=2951999 RepID=UPI002D25AE66|nr:CusA/CzcA family heavy metal efflux RND transporter [Alloacidobacterium sp.]HYK35584.1 CusA/CzcA family heavy metal efflux RND transporter [Alloacidobacterium sp.]
MIHRIVQFALRQRLLVLMVVLIIAVAGAISFQHMPVDAYPDLSPPMVEIITQWPGHAAEEVERLVTVPTEVEMNGVPKMSVMRSISLYGLSDVRLTFDEDTDDYFARQVVFERLSEVTYPTGVTPTLAPLTSPSGLVYRYVIQSPDRTPQELKVYEDWVIEREYKQVPGVADDSGFGGTVMQYQVLLDPARLYGYHITVPTVLQQLAANNSNAGGGFYSQGGQFYYVRGLGLVHDTSDIGNIVVGSQNGVPVRIRDIGDVTIGNAPRLGEFGFNKTNDAVEGVIMMRRGEQTQNVLKGVEAKTEQLNNQILPPDIKVRPYYDRSDLVQLTIDTVEHNMLLGMALVLIVLMFFLVSVRAAVIVALTIPLSLLFSFVFLHLRGVAANLLSIGAIDFGILIDGTLVMVENIFRELGLREGQSYDLQTVILDAAKDVDRPIFYSVAVIIAGYLPIYALSGPSGKLFKPMADTVSVALVGALILTLTFVPVMCAYWFKKGVRERINKPFEWVRDKYAVQLEWCLNHPKTTMVASTVIFALSLLLVPFIGGEFMPHLDEGALWVRATMPYTISFEEASKFSPKVRDILMKYPMVTDVGSELGRPDDGTDPTGFFNDEFYVGLKPYNDASWKATSIHNKAELTEDIQNQLKAFPGVIFNYTQPAEDAVDEALTGLKSALAVKIYGPDLNVLQSKALEIKRRLSQVPGFAELTVVRELGQPSLLIDVDRDKIARYGINVADVEAIVQAAVGGEAATQVIQGEKLFDLVVRMKPEFRENAQQIGNLLVGTPAGQQIPLSELANIHEASGASFIYRENNSRYIGVQYSIEGRDLERAVADGQKSIEDIAKSLPPGYRLAWGGEYGEFLEAKHQMELIGPLAVLIIFMILFALYGNIKFPVTIALGVILTVPVGVLPALLLTHTTFSVSSALGLLALMGVSVETAVILVSYINKLRIENKDIRTATLEASLLRLRPIMMTALVACLGLLPAALSTGIGSDTQKPFAIVIVTGLISRLFLGFFVNPVLYEMVARDGDVLQV